MTIEIRRRRPLAAFAVKGTTCGRVAGSFGFVASRRGCTALALAAAIATIAGCPRPLPDFGPSPYEEAEEVLFAVHGRLLSPDAFIGDARVRIIGPMGRGSADHFVVVRPPADLRLETLSFFGNPIVLVLVSDGRFLLWEIDAGRAWEGAATADNLGALLPLDLGPEAVAGLLTGAPPLFHEEKRLDLDHENRRYVVSLRQGREWQQLVVHPHDLTVDEVRWFDAAGDVRARLHYDRYRVVLDGLVFPHEIRYETTEDISLRVLYRDITFDPAPEKLEGLFSLRLPEDVEVFPLEPEVRPPSVIPRAED